MAKTSKAKKRRECKPEDICKFLAELNVWLKWMHQDYTKLRIAVCNVEAKAFDKLGTQAKRFCKAGGPGGDPLPPTEPPKWE